MSVNLQEAIQEQTRVLSEDEKQQVLQFIHRLRQQASQPQSFLRVARALQLQGPTDWSERLDDYLYGGATVDDE